MGQVWRLVVAVNAVGTLSAGAGLAPGVILWPAVAEAASARQVASPVAQVALDAGLCFGPLLVPLALVTGGLGLHAAWGRLPGAGPLNGTAAAAWVALALGLATCVRWL